MTCLRTLPLLEGSKLIVLDEGLDAMYARTLIAGWLQMWKEKDPNYVFELLSFSDPKSYYKNEPKPFSSNNLRIHDYYTVDLNVIHEKDFDTLEHILKSNKIRSTTIVDCLSSLILYVGLAKALWFIERLSKQVPQLICVYRRDFVQNKVPRIETLGTTYVKLRKHLGVRTSNNITYAVEIVHRKVGGTIFHQLESVNQNNDSYDIFSEKIEARNVKRTEPESQKPKTDWSFRIEMNASEMEQRDKTVLPYTLAKNVENVSKILYHPEDIDDIDEEDPDDDLCI